MSNYSAKTGPGGLASRSSPVVCAMGWGQIPAGREFPVTVFSRSCLSVVGFGRGYNSRDSSDSAWSR